IENNDAWLLSYELTLMIFLYLDPKSITQCMLVCRHFLEIANDSAIRQLLWCTKDAIERRVMLKSLTASDRFSSGFERLISSHLQMADPSIKDTDEILRPYRAEQPGSHGFVMRN
ncbi:MAG: F-box protein, partial [Proteobacteria bacterium]|nr:F-box protein [Pseudomonadota bacterium]